MKRGVLLLVIILVLAGGIGWYVWGKNKNDNSTAKTDTTRQSIPTNYLKISQKGIKIELTPKINDAYYYINAAGNTYVSLHRFDNNPEAKGCTAKGNNGEGGGIELLMAAKPGDDNAGSPWTQQQLEDKRSTNGASVINGTYYWLEPTHASCTSSNDTESINIENEIGVLRGEFVKIQNTITTI